MFFISQKNIKDGQAHIKNNLCNKEYLVTLPSARVTRL